MELYILLCLAAIIVVLEIIILAGSRKSGKSDGLEQNFRHMEGYVADEFQRNRKETADSLKDMLHCKEKKFCDACFTGNYPRNAANERQTKR